MVCCYLNVQFQGQRVSFSAFNRKDWGRPESVCFGRNSNLAPPEYKYEASLFEQTRLITIATPALTTAGGHRPLLL